MKRIISILLLLSCACTSHDINPCVDPEKIEPIVACPFNVDPVCGCNNVTYDNSCFAKAAGVVRWTDGACN